MLCTCHGTLHWLDKVLVGFDFKSLYPGGPSVSYRASTSFLHSLRSCAARLALFQVMLLLLSSCSHELNKISSWSPALSFSPHGGSKQCLPGCAELQFYQHVLCTTKM